MNKYLWVWIIVIVIGVGAYFIGQSSNATTPPSSAPLAVTTASQVSDINLKSKCATDGQAFYLNFYKQFTQVKSVWFDPQFHFNSKLNTCLVYISWNDTSNASVGLTYYSITNNNIVYDIYSNKAVLQSSIVRAYNYVNGDLSGKPQETDTLDDYPYSQNIPNSNADTFSNQLGILMNE